MFRVLLLTLFLLTAGAQAQTFAGFHWGLARGLHLGYNDADWGVRAGGWPGQSGGIYGADAYFRLTTDANRSAWYFGAGTTYWADREFFDLYLRALVGYEWRLAPGFGLYLEYGPGLSVASRIPQGGIYLLPLAALIRFDLGMNLYF